MEALLKELDGVQTFFNQPPPQKVEIPVTKIPNWAKLAFVVVIVLGVWGFIAYWNDREKTKNAEAEKQRLKAALARYGLPIEQP